MRCYKCNARIVLIYKSDIGCVEYFCEECKKFYGPYKAHKLFDIANASFFENFVDEKQMEKENE